MNPDQPLFAHKYGPWALIAGASEGIGKSFAEQLASRGLNLILLARREDVLADTARQIRERFHVEVKTQALDLTAADLETHIDTLIVGHDIGMLVYNAGAVHGVGLFLEEPIEKALNLVRLNCVGPVVLSHKIGQRLKVRGRGGVILMSSMTALAGMAYVATYAATKSFDMIFAESLWAEFRGYGVDAMGLIAGATQTPAMQKSGAQFGEELGSSADKPADAPMTNVLAMDPDDVVREALAYFGQGPILIPGEKNRASAQGLRQAPRPAVIDAMSAAAAGMYGKPWPLTLRQGR